MHPVCISVQEGRPVSAHACASSAAEECTWAVPRIASQGAMLTAGKDAKKRPREVSVCALAALGLGVNSLGREKCLKPIGACVSCRLRQGVGDFHGLLHLLHSKGQAEAHGPAQKQSALAIGCDRPSACNRGSRGRASADPVPEPGWGAPQACHLGRPRRRHGRACFVFPCFPCACGPGTCLRWPKGLPAPVPEGPV